MDCCVGELQFFRYFLFEYSSSYKVRIFDISTADYLSWRIFLGAKFEKIESINFEEAVTHYLLKAVIKAYITYRIFSNIS